MSWRVTLRSNALACWRPLTYQLLFVSMRIWLKLSWAIFSCAVSTCKEEQFGSLHQLARCTSYLSVNWCHTQRRHFHVLIFLFVTSVHGSFPLKGTSTAYTAFPCTQVQDCPLNQQAQRINFPCTCSQTILACLLPNYALWTTAFGSEGTQFCVSPFTP